MSSIGAELPRELIDAIMDYAGPDKHGLATYGLVCKTWLPSTRHRLFTNLRLNSFNTYTFLDLLVSPLPFVSTYTRRVTVSDGSHYDRTITIEPWINAFFLQLPEFPSLRSLFLEGFSPLYLTPETKATFFVTSCGITELDIMGNDGLFDVPEDFIRTLGVFSRLERLTLWTKSRWGECKPAIAERPAPSTLQYMRLTCDPKAELLTWLLQNGAAPHSVRLDARDEEGFAVIGGCCKALGSMLKSLELDLDDFVSRNSMTFLECFNLNHNPELVKLRFNMTLTRHGSWDQGMRTMGWVSRILSPLVSPRLEKITFRVLITSISELDFYHDDWVNIAQPLEQMRLPKLRKVRFDLSWSQTWDPEESRPRQVALMEKVRKLLPRCARRGILKISSLE